MAISKPAKAGIDIIFAVGYIDEVEVTGFNSQEESVSSPAGLPLESHFPTMQVAGKAKIGIGHPVGLEIVAEVSNPDSPVGGQLNIAPHAYGVGGDDSRIPVVSGGSADGKIVGDAEPVEEA